MAAIGAQAQIGTYQEQGTFPNVEMAQLTPSSLGFPGDWRPGDPTSERGSERASGQEELAEKEKE
ncbi:hypothetical protein N7488_009579 [Penicillium malachiteum]|nr:hypothetical protein N7488_009579 [Penicillium malachiteum]